MIENLKRYLLLVFVLSCGVGLILAYLSLSNPLNNPERLLIEGQQVRDADDEFTVSAVSVAEIDYFTEARMERMRSRSLAMDSLKGIAESSHYHESVRLDAQKNLMELIKRSEHELQIEELVRARGFTDCLALIHANGVTVVIRAGSLVLNDVAKVADIVKRVTGVSEEQIVISEF